MNELLFTNIEGLADWIESSLLVSTSQRFGTDAIIELAAEELGVSATRVALAMSAIQKRQSMLGSSYPFGLNEVAVWCEDSDARHDYETLLMLTPNSAARQTVRASVTQVMADLFESVCERALVNFWGTGGNAIGFGFPSKYGRPPEFDQAITWLAAKMKIEPGRGYRPPLRKDGGVDIVAWRPFSDSRSGFPVALVQCTVQGDILPKASDVDLRLWASWLAMDVDPIRSCHSWHAAELGTTVVTTDNKDLGSRQE